MQKRHHRRHISGNSNLQPLSVAIPPPRSPSQLGASPSPTSAAVTPVVKKGRSSSDGAEKLPTAAAVGGGVNVAAVGGGGSLVRPQTAGSLLDGGGSSFNNNNRVMRPATASGYVRSKPDIFYNDDDHVGDDDNFGAVDAANLVLSELREKIYREKKNIKSSFLEFDRDRDGFVSFDDMRETLMQQGFLLPNVACERALFRMLTQGRSDAVNFRQFVRMLKISDTTGKYNEFEMRQSMLPCNSSSPSPSKNSNGDDAVVVDWSLLPEEDKASVVQLRESVRNFVHVRSRSTRDAFRHIDDRKLGMITSEDLHRFLESNHFQVSRVEVRKLISAFQSQGRKRPLFGGDSCALTMEEFVKLMGESKPQTLSLSTVTSPTLRNYPDNPSPVKSEQLPPRPASVAGTRDAYARESRPSTAQSCSRSELLEQIHQARIEAIRNKPHAPDPKTWELPTQVQKLTRNSLKELQDRFYQKGSSTRAIFLSFDKDQDGKVSRAELEQGLKASGMNLHPEFGSELFNRYDRDRDGALNMKEFDELLGRNLASPFREDLSSMAFNADNDVVQFASKSRFEQSPLSHFESDADMITMIRDKAYKYSTRFSKVWRLFDENKDGKVSKSEFEYGLNSLNIRLPDDLKKKLTDAVFVNKEDLMYNDFVKCLKASDRTGQYNHFLQGAKTAMSVTDIFSHSGLDNGSTVGLGSKSSPQQQQQMLRTSSSSYTSPPPTLFYNSGSVGSTLQLQVNGVKTSPLKSKAELREDWMQRTLQKRKDLEKIHHS